LWFGRCCMGCSVVRRAARVDAPQKEIVKALRDYGCLVAHTHTVAGGFPDLVVASPPGTDGRRRVGLVEVKTPQAAKRKDNDRTNEQIEFWENWKDAPMALVTDVDGALRFARMLAFEGTV
jgi:hypothetical protein